MGKLKTAGLIEKADFFLGMHINKTWAEDIIPQPMFYLCQPILCLKQGPMVHHDRWNDVRYTQSVPAVNGTCRRLLSPKNNFWV